MPEVSGSRLADLTGRGWRTVKARLEQAGVRPTRRERNADLFDSVAALAAIYGIPDGGDFESQRERLAAAQAEKYEAENALRRGELAPMPSVHATWTDHIAAARSRLLAMGTKLGPQLTNVGDASVIAAAIRAEVASALAELADYEPPAGDGGPEGLDQAGGSSVGTAAGADGQPVGRRRKKAVERE